MTNAVARVFVNDVEVGSLPANQYQSIVDELRHDRRLYVLQGINLIATLWRCLVLFVRVMPMFWLILFIAIVLFDPDSMTWILSEIAKAKPADITHGIRNAMFASIAFTIIVFGFSSVFGFGGYSFGYVNQFHSAINKRIRSLLEVPAEGNMRVMVVDGDEHHGQ